MERIEGYVVGRKTIDGLPTWSVRIKQDGGELNGVKLIVASVAKGVTLRAGLDVDFVLATSIDLPMAADVAPKGVVTAHKKELTAMRKNIISSAVFLTVVAILIIGGGALLVFKPWELKAVQNQLIETRAETNLNWIRGMTFWDIVPDRVIRDAIRQSAKRPSYGARQAILDYRICPVFGQSYNQPQSKCFNALYAANSASSKEWLERDGLPGSIGMTIHESRFRLLSTVRSYLMSPTNLQDAYFAKRSVLVDEFLKLDVSQQKYLVGQVRKAHNAFGNLNAGSFLPTLVAEYVAAEQSWINSEYDTPQYNAARDRYSDAEEALKSATSSIDTDIEWALFGYRRMGDGGFALLRTYLIICDDLLGVVKGLN